MKSIKTKLIAHLGLLMGIVCIGLSVISYVNASNELKSNIGKTLPALAEQTASNIQGRIEGKLSCLEAVAARDDIKDPNVPIEKKISILLDEVKRNGSIRMSVIDKDGNLTNSDGTTANVKERPYFKNALSGKSNVSDPLVNKTDNSVVVVYAVPIKNNNEIVGVLIETRDGNKLSELTDQAKIGQTGTGFMINKQGTTVANKNRDLVLQMNNMIEEAKKDSKLQSLSDIESKMITGQQGIGEYKYSGADKFVGYAPVNGTDWFVGIIVDENEILSELSSLEISTSLSSIIFILIGLATIYIIANKLSKSLKSTSSHLALLAEGNLCKEVSKEHLKLNDEVGEMTNSMKVMQESLGRMIKKIKESSSNINDQSENLSSISEEIASASQNVTEAISEVAEGTGNQSEQLIQITEILSEFSDKLSDMVKEIQVVDSNSREIGSMASDSSNEMNELNISVTNIGKSFKEFYNKIITLGKDINEINEITNLINSISEQTNLLALNAAIEAARAGESGKGFSVVAEEIRNLAEQSKDSSESISKLISEISGNADEIVQESVMMDDEMRNQAKIIENSILSFKKIIGAVDEVIPKIETVKTSAENIENHKNTILNRIDGLSSVSAEVSASSEEISASSEEVNASTEEVASSAQVLNNMTNEMLEEVNKFIV
ncbi:methyl-accepting chemotaxis protein [Clostridium saccharobutylicum]|uniref:Methyl-accepting chemotaxis protein n=3 Tax=Clostridium saccharobutylicum TaxID=169679 RepID=U5MV59_CLOSA|nr:methyl-accepting chemotaxis protein [Clostridium saccharobutylicum]AGX44689.1 methyl-accepting chemotaxis protein [Clostridium saccharobutylicum DSM 13864]AQR91978.1 methyl-accepting chemotaxis protein McpB [Clostridium saccharobutylicum]AQS01880.1 methyl-accepting chemotaxis protein McpB [Clostridium saccharobutylicum]AQS11479.1 methyl-accepting chemotaxis protein McpB [Clostridium saccharobutylicum]AQS15863.1 methyl-accepting chemotaxis protein McpB [Clostridium saccharobutylicum]